MLLATRTRPAKVTAMVLWLVVYGVMSCTAFVAYAVDKRAAVGRRRRTPEVVLHALEFAGGWPGAWLAQRTLRHKNAKVPYQIVFWLIVALHVLGWWTWWWR